MSLVSPLRNSPIRRSISRSMRDASFPSMGMRFGSGGKAQGGVAINNGLLLEDDSSFILLEDGTSILLLEAA